MKKILLFGGAFDPFHIGHEMILKATIAKVKPDKTFLVPTKQKWWSGRWLSAAEHRIKMLQIGIQQIPNCAISSFELEQEAETPWIDTLCYFKEQFPDSELYFLIGSDQYWRFHEWKDADKILELAQMVVYRRDEKLISDPSILLVDGQVMNISSTLIREKPEQKMLQPEILDYINAYGLYAAERVQKCCKTEKRYQHCLRVGYYARDLMLLVDPEQAHLAYTAGVYHDICKEMNPDEQVQIAQKELGIENFASWKVLHGPVGAWFLQTHFLMNNEVILNAIRRHTKPFDFGTPTPLDKILYLADKLEPLRTDEDTPGIAIAELRALAKTDYESCFQKLYQLLENKY